MRKSRFTTHQERDIGVVDGGVSAINNPKPLHGKAVCTPPPHLAIYADLCYRSRDNQKTHRKLYRSPANLCTAICKVILNDDKSQPLL